jgi:hypothetical protein
MLVAVQYSTIQLQFVTVSDNTMQCNTIQRNTMQCNSIQYNTIRYIPPQHSSIQHNRVQSTDVLRIGLAAVSSARFTGITKPTLLCSIPVPVPAPDCDDDGCIPSEESAVLSVGYPLEKRRIDENAYEWT